MKALQWATTAPQNTMLKKRVALLVGNTGTADEPIWFPKFASVSSMVDGNISTGVWTQTRLVCGRPEIDYFAKTVDFKPEVSGLTDSSGS